MTFGKKKQHPCNFSKVEFSKVIVNNKIELRLFVFFFEYLDLPNYIDLFLIWCSTFCMKVVRLIKNPDEFHSTLEFNKS